MPQAITVPPADSLRPTAYILCAPRRPMAPLLLLPLLACTGEEPKDSETPTFSPESPGPYTPAHTAGTLVDAARSRELLLELWYPGVGDRVTAPITDFIADPDQKATYEALWEAAPPDCPTQNLSAPRDLPEATGGPWPLVVLSHCYGCTRYSTATVAEHLASHGFVVLAPDHTGDTLFDHLDGGGLPLNADTLELREGDLEFVLDKALAGEFGVEVDPARVGLMGHSFGSVTVALLLQRRLNDPPRAAMMVGAPPENPLLPGVDMAALQAPLLFLRLAEDNSIGLAGNILIENNFNEAPGAATLVDMADAGHWSPSDLVGLTEDFMPGCGDGKRQDGGDDFTYLPAAEGRRLSRSIALSFFSSILLEDEGATTWLQSGGGEQALTIQQR